MVRRTREEIEKMYSEEIQQEMLQIWHDVDFNIVDADEVLDQLRIYRDVLRTRHYEYRRF